ncbi:MULTISPECIES: LuxR C-terminal-related transcriptional regulator [unclassified Agromyces]|uniref:LuxR C-terminal-related transcriptional regulator n=1 Tax=unclassified Agromyces TaxID=2639701 RepID=UPI0030142950
MNRTALDAGRTAMAERRWAAAYEDLSRADAGEGLAPADLESLAMAAFLRGEAQAAVDALERAHARLLADGDLEGAARTAARLALYQIELGDLSHNFEWVPKGLRLAAGMAEPSAVTGAVQLPPAVAQLASGDPAGARGRFRAIGGIADRFRDPDLAALAAFGEGMCLLELEEDAEAFSRLDDAVAAVTAGGISPVSSGIILCTVVGSAHQAFDLERATAWTTVLERWCRGQPELVAYRGQAHALRAAILTLHGAWDEAWAEAELALSRFRAGDYRAAFGAPYRFGELQRLRGAFHSASESYRRAGESAWDPQPGLALLHLAEGKVRQARDEIRRTATAADPFARRHLLPAVVDIEATAGGVAEARRALTELRLLAGRHPTAMSAVVIAFAEATVLLAEGDAAGAVTAGRSAADAWKALGVPYETARSRVLAGRALQAVGEPAAARSEFDAARAILLELGAHPDLEALPTGTGERHGSVLTDRELEVLRLVSTGLTNRAIAARLSLSEKTVARHLSNIFGKLGLSTRAAATAYAYENGLV